MDLPGKYYDSIDLLPGDIIIESSTNCVGFLVKRSRHIDMIEDDIYFWHIVWSDPKLIQQFNNLSSVKEFKENGAVILNNSADVLSKSDLICKVNFPDDEEFSQIKEKSY